MEKYAITLKELADEDWKTQLARKYPNVPKGAKVKILQEDYINFYGGPWSRIEWNDNWYWVSPKDLKAIDPKLVDVIDEAIKTSKSNLEAFEKVMKYKKEVQGLTGFHCSVYPKDFNNPEPIDSETVAKVLLAMMRAEAEGRYEDVTGQEL